MGRHPKPNEEKQAAGTYRPDRDKTVTVQAPEGTPEMPLSLEKEGQRFWADAYTCKWITAADQHQVQLVAEKKDERVRVSKACQQDPTDWRLARTLKDLDRDIQDGLAQLLLTPNARKRAGVVVETEKPRWTVLTLMRANADGEISREEYDREMEALGRPRRREPNYLKKP